MVGGDDPLPARSTTDIECNFCQGEDSPERLDVDANKDPEHDSELGHL